jgi:hypothetical protein
MTTPDSATTTDATRCSDEERERTSSRLHVAAGEGRLTLEEVEERLATVYAARFRHELDAVTADLPSPATPTTGWRPIVTMTRHQLLGDVSALVGRGPATISRNRKVVLALTALAVLLLFVTMVVLALHGIGGEGPEHHGLDRG